MCPPPPSLPPPVVAAAWRSCQLWESQSEPATHQSPSQLSHGAVKPDASVGRSAEVLELLLLQQLRLNTEGYHRATSVNKILHSPLCALIQAQGSAEEKSFSASQWWWDCSVSAEGWGTGCTIPKPGFFTHGSVLVSLLCTPAWFCSSHQVHWVHRFKQLGPSVSLLSLSVQLLLLLPQNWSSFQEIQWFPGSSKAAKQLFGQSDKIKNKNKKLKKINYGKSETL